ncbi:ATP-binding protein [Breoghania sp. L-A4]|uniref:ATP-binding protein n=1 Tax=Breoghania sp. L-A4 TaxID=2304600 RepID=UPI000E358541|nr:ATP-binding protein [Breoghania sp. L-A4]AXS39613.1 two-component sensor histidine kinase [Breoghania sp. L-A4]
MTDDVNRTNGERREQGGWHATWRRLEHQRWLLACVAALLTAAVSLHEVPPRHALMALGVIVLVAAFAPQRRRAMKLSTNAPSKGFVWPETGMKVIVDALPHPCFIVDRRGVTRYMNALAAKRFGTITPGDPLSFALRAPSLLEGLDRVSGGGATERIAWTEKVPTESWYEAHMAPMRLPSSPLRDGGKPDFVLVSVLDLTEQHRLERMRADFVANASHELRTPLASLTGFIETLQGPARDDPAARERFLKIMLEQAERMARLIDDLLSLSRIELKANLRPDARVDLNDVARSVIDAMTPLARELGVRLEVNLPSTPMLAAGERDELVQVLGNLTENALKYGADGERVEISARHAPAPNGPGEWLLTVRDWGPGIASKHLPRLTERFYRVDDAMSREMKGTGLGLAIVKHILNRHRARLEIVSTPGSGAAFTVHIKAVEDTGSQPVS